MSVSNKISMCFSFPSIPVVNGIDEVGSVVFPRLHVIVINLIKCSLCSSSGRFVSS
jgi:hypothetical protein